MKTDIHAPAGFEPTISAGERSQTYALDSAATGIGLNTRYIPQLIVFINETKNFQLVRLQQ